MTKTEFISAIANRTQQKVADVKPIIEAALTIIEEQLAAGESVIITGFGTFEARERQATTARNPRTGETVEVPAKRAPAFKPAKALKEAVDNSSADNGNNDEADEKNEADEKTAEN